MAKPLSSGGVDAQAAHTAIDRVETETRIRTHVETSHALSIATTMRVRLFIAAVMLVAIAALYFTVHVEPRSTRAIGPTPRLGDPVYLPSPIYVPRDE